MDLSTIAISVLSSSFASAGVSYLIWIQQKKHEFKYDYRKYVLKKRIEAYEEVEKIIYMYFTAYSKAVTKEVYHGIFQSPDSLKNIQERLLKFTSLGIWLTQDLLETIRTLHDKSVDGLQLETTDLIQEFGVKNYKLIYELSEKLRNQYYRDIQSLSDIDKFFVKGRFDPKNAKQLPAT